MGFGGLGIGIVSLPVLSDATTRSISAENPTGEPGKGGTAVPNPEDPNLPHSGKAADVQPLRNQPRKRSILSFSEARDLLGNPDLWPHPVSYAVDKLVNK